MRTAIINIKTDKEIKKSARELAESLGLSLSAIINAYLRQFIRNREAYFTLAPKMSPQLERLIGQVEVDIRKNRNLSSEISSAKDLERHFSSIK